MTIHFPAALPQTLSNYYYHRIVRSCIAEPKFHYTHCQIGMGEEEGGTRSQRESEISRVYRFVRRRSSCSPPGRTDIIVVVVLIDVLLLSAEAAWSLHCFLKDEMGIWKMD